MTESRQGEGFFMGIDNAAEGTVETVVSIVKIPCPHSKCSYTRKVWHFRRGTGISIEKHTKVCKCGYRRTSWEIVHEHIR